MIFHKKIEEVFKAKMYARCDDRGAIKYFSHEDFEGLSVTPYPFRSSHGHTLNGYVYSYEGYDQSRLVVFEHGFGGGHRSYMKEIEILCRAGYRVLAYDHTGCMTSGGKGANGFAQSLCDLDDCLKALKADGTLPTRHLSVVGHSWGGFSTMNIPALHPDVERIVVFSGFVSVERIVAQNFPGILKGYRKHILALEQAANPSYVGFDGAETLQKAKTKALLVYSDNDKLVQKAAHYDVLHAALDGKETVAFLLEAQKGHNPNYTKDAVAYLATLGPALKKAKPKTAEEKRGFQKSFDWQRATAQDETVWAKVLAFLAE